ncbi:MAG: xanthine dehydrogenase family protein molybdopterin-binding subunit [Haliscomenobacter sp.]|nr:xanthine dehydrogenase family protein molybdopterin-binding subunit [Haliscomenobacter sp.]MBP9077201.1 xanthine dehydrogenase family protein molybdopterin-binding subunit [Haliscomenobacter sp.]MBP9873171.1 xanthine dehydrogenase family protein molybdopterin-binding subunit [Haliscomenobacter sp.]
MSNHTTNRREFIKTASAAGAFLAVGLSGAGKILALSPFSLLGNEAGGEIELNTFILITADNRITLFNPRPEMGQGTFQSMPALIAEELEVSLSQVTVRITDGQPKYGWQQWVGGSNSVQGSWMPLRKVGAAAKEMLIQAAAKRWKAAPADCYAENANVLHRPTGKSLTYGELVADASTLDVPKEPKLKDPKDFKIIGKSLPRPEIPSKVNGTALFGIDVSVPGMLYATVQHCPLIHGKLVSFNEAEVRQMPGVKHVFKVLRPMPHKSVEGVAVVADTFWQALKARQALQIEWDNTGYETISTEDYFAQARKKAAEMDGPSYGDAVGDFKAAYKTAKKTVEAVYQTPFAAHAPIEPMNATAKVVGDKVEIWVPTQSPLGVKDDVSKHLGIPKENVNVHVIFMGGSFGRKSYHDFAVEAVLIAKQAGAPVKLIWTREDDMVNGPFRPGMINALKGGFDAQGKPIAWEHKITGASLNGQMEKLDLNGKVDDWAPETVDQNTSPYAIPNRRQAFIWQPTDIPVLWWRSVYASTNAFAQESFVDEMAHAAKKDPLDFRLELLKAQPRWINVLEILAEKTDYRRQRAAGKSIGIAIAHSFNTTAAWAVAVSKNAGGGVRIEKAVCVIDCGMVVNPDTVAAQTEGNAIMAMSAALKPGITFTAGEAQETNYHQYPLPSMGETPPIEVHIIPSQEAPGGIGEPGLPPFAPALFNAVFLATGKRVRTLPVDLGSV